MKKFYKKAEAGTAPGGYAVRLDGKTLKTPLQHPLVLESKELADLIAAEWNAQGEEIAPSSMPYMQLVSTMIDKIANGHERAAMEAEVARYFGSDLVCYFADHPANLVVRHEKHWRPLIDWLAESHGMQLEAVSGIQYHVQPAATRAKAEALARKLDAPDFTILQIGTAVTGSPVITLALMQGRLTVEEAWQAACVDEIYQLEKWGEDGPARQRLDRIRHELEALETFGRLIRTSA